MLTEEVRLLLRYFIALLMIVVFSACNSSAQSFSNMGTEFYTVYAEHIYPAGPAGTSNSNASYMLVYITSDKNATGIIEIMDGSFSQPFSVAANQVMQIAIKPGANLKGLSGIRTKQAVHITANVNISVYAHIYGATTVGVSGATMLLPVKALGKDYRSVNFTQTSNSVAFGEGKSYSFFNVIATEDNTSIQITPAAPVYNTDLNSTKPAGVPYIITLPNKGDVYQGLADNDLTGTRMQSFSPGAAPCNPIAVFSGSSKTSIVGGVSACTLFQTADNLFQQVYPVSSWGTRFATVPLAGRETKKDIYRIIVTDPATVLIGTPPYQQSDLLKGYLEFVTDQPMVINSSKPVQVAQYAVSQFAATCNNLSGDLGDPEMIYLNPVEQAVTSTSFYAAGRYAITKSFINVAIPTDAVASFKLDGAPVNASIFLPIVGNASFSYAQIPVSNGPQATGGATPNTGAHFISADKPFNAVAYGFGNYESYGYSAGAGFSKLNEIVALKDPATNSTSQTTLCSGTGYTPQLTLPFQVSQITWKFDDGTSYKQNNPAINYSVSYNQTVYTYNYFNADKNTGLVFLPAGTRKVIASVANPLTGCGTDDNEINITVIDAPVPIFTTAGSCAGQSVTFSISAPANVNDVLSSVWDFGDGATAASLNPTHIYATAGDYNVRLTVNYIGGCSAVSVVKILHIDNKPVASFTTSVPDCTATAITFTDTSNPSGVTGNTWLWTFGDGTTSALQNPIHTYANTGAYAVTLLVTNAGGCAGNLSLQNITINPLPAITIVQPLPICLEAAPVTILVKKNNLIGTEAFSGDGVTTAGLFDPAKAGVGIHVVNYVFTATQTGCTYLQAFNIEVIATPTAPIFTYAGVCAGGLTNFSMLQPTATANIISYSWDFGDGVILLAGADASHQYAAPGNYVVVLTTKYSNGCSSVLNGQTVHISKKPVASFTYSSPDCLSTSITFTDASSDPEGGIITGRLWDFGDGTTSSLQNPTHPYAAAQTYTVTLSATSTSGCQSTSVIQNITVNPLPIITIDQPPVICQSAAPIAIIANKGALVGSGVFTGDGISLTGVFNPAKAGSGTHAINYIFTSALTGCSNTQTVSITVIPTPAAPVFTYSGSCVGNATIFTITQPVSTLNITGYSWDFGDGNIISSVGSVSHQYASPGDYQVVLITTSSNGCAATSAALPVHIGKVPIANFSYSSLNCSGTAVAFTDASADPEGSTLTTWSWNFGDGVTSTLQNPAHVYTDGGTYVLTLQVSNKSGCQSLVSTKNIAVVPMPVITIAQPAPLCIEDATITIKAMVSGSAGTGIFTGQGISKPGDFNAYNAGAGIHVITYTFTTSGGCTYTITFNIVVYPTPVVTIGNDVTVLAGDSITLSAKAGGDALSYRWSPATGLSRDNILNPVASPLNDTKYTLTVTSGTGCTVFANISVTVLKNIQINNTFTPNGDGVNDLWRIDLLNNYPQALVNIYTRNGEKVFSSVGYSVPWDGKFGGAELPVGVYYYIVNLKNGRKPIAGFVTIIR